MHQSNCLEQLEITNEGKPREDKIRSTQNQTHCNHTVTSDGHFLASHYSLRQPDACLLHGQVECGTLHHLQGRRFSQS